MEIEYIRRQGKKEKAGCMGPQMVQGRHFPGDPAADHLPVPLWHNFIYALYYATLRYINSLRERG